MLRLIINRQVTLHGTDRSQCEVTHHIQTDLDSSMIFMVHLCILEKYIVSNFLRRKQCKLENYLVMENVYFLNLNEAIALNHYALFSYCTTKSDRSNRKKQCSKTKTLFFSHSLRYDLCACVRLVDSDSR